MKKTISILLIICTLTLCLASCDNSTSHTHSYVESIYTQPSCNKWSSGKGDKKYTCSECGYYYIDYGSIPALEHSYVESIHNEPTCGTYGKGDKKYTCSECGDYYIDYDSIPALECEWVEATCTLAKKCTRCGRTEGYMLGHDYSNTTDGTCTRCGFGVKFILPSTPVTIKYNGVWDQECKIESIKIEKDGSYYKLRFIVQSTYHEKGDNYSDDACFGWKLYDEDGLVVTSGTGYTDGNIKVGEKSKDTISLSIGENNTLQNGKTYRLELLDIG